MKKFLEWWYADNRKNKKVLTIFIVIFNTILAYFYGGAEFGFFTFVFSALLGAGLVFYASIPALIKIDLILLILSPLVLVFLTIKKMFF